MDVLFLSLGTAEILVIAIVGLLLFGRRLPEVGRSVGKSFMEFKRGMADIQGEMFELDRMADDAARQPRAKAVAPPAAEPRNVDAREVSTDTGAAETESTVARGADSVDDRREPDSDQTSD